MARQRTDLREAASAWPPARATSSRWHSARARGPVRGRQVGEGPLSQQHFGAVRAGGHERMPTLEDPRVHERADRESLGRRFDRVPKVSCLGVAVAMSCKVPADSFAEAFRAEVLLEHPKKAAALLVGEGIEHRVDLVGRAHRELDWPRRVEPSRERAISRSRLNPTQHWYSGLKSSRQQRAM